MVRIQRTAFAGVAVLLGALALSAAPAGAATGYLGLCPSLETRLCTSPGLAIYFGFGLAVDNSGGPSNGDVWFEKGVDGSGNGLVKFDASGNELLEVDEENIPGSARQAFSSNSYATDLAVDPTSGDVYLSTQPRGSGLGEVTKFDPSGVFQFQLTGSETPQHAFDPISVAVDPSGDLYVADVNGWIDRFTPSGQYIEQFPLPSGMIGPKSEGTADRIAVGPEGNVYVASRGQVKEYSPTGAPVNCPGGSNALPVEGGEAEEMVAIDPSDGHIFASASSAEGAFIAEYSSLCATAPSAKLRAGGSGLAVSGSTHWVYLSGYQSGNAGIFGQVTLPDTTTSAPATGITRTSAAVSGTVNPDGTEVTICEFEWGISVGGYYGNSEPCTQTLPLEGNSPIEVSAELHLPLPPASLVHYRLKSGDANGYTVGEDHTFYTEGLPPPVVGGLPASSVTQFAATLNGTLQTSEALVNYRFQYGTTTAYGAVEPIPDGVTSITTETIPISQPITNLQAGTTYHYRLVASSPGATEVKGPDETFTTLPVPAPSVSTGAASKVGVGSATVSGTVDPHGWDTTYLFEYGTTTAYGASWPTVLVDMGALEGPQPVLVSIPNLLPNTTYHYRLVANNGGGTSYGQDMTFTTGEYPVPAIQEPPTLGTLLVPTLGEAPKGLAKKGKKARKGKKRPKAKRKARRTKKH
jgi:hypothetical protein